MIMRSAAKQCYIFRHLPGPARTSRLDRQGEGRSGSALAQSNGDGYSMLISQNNTPNERDLDGFASRVLGFA